MERSLSRVTEAEIVKVKELVHDDVVLGEKAKFAANLAKKDTRLRDQANEIARTFIDNRRALGVALSHLVGSGKKSATLAHFGLKGFVGRHISSQAQLLAKLPEEDLEKELERMSRSDVIQLAPLYRVVKTLLRHERQEKRRGKLKGDGWTLQKGDFVKAVERIAEPGTIHAIVTDPPYGKKYIKEYGRLIRLADRFLREGGHLVVMTGQMYLPEIFDAMKGEELTTTYRWMSCYVTRGASTQIWARKIKSNWKPVLWYAKGDPVIEPFCDVIDNETPDRRFHKWGQSVAGMAALIERFTVEGEIVLDPFVGAGSIAVAAATLKRQFLGTDKSRSCIQKTSERLRGL